MKNKIFAGVLITAMAVAGSLAIISAPAANALDQTNASADVVIGQIDFTSHVSNRGGSPGANTVALVDGVWSDGKKLIAADLFNNRVLIYNSIPTTNDASADVVIGQADFSSAIANRGGSAGPNTLNVPYFVFSDGVRLFISDSSNNRVLIYNTIPTSNNASADVVIGQADFSSILANRGGSVGPNTLSFPVGIYSDGTKLFIADRSNNRVLVFNSIPTTNNANADYVIGQTVFTSNAFNQGGSAGANTLFGPYSVFAHSGKLFIGDDTNNRVLIFNSIPTASNASADVVVGQQDFSSRLDNQGGTAGANTLAGAMSVFSDDTRLYVSDIANYRVLIYNSIPTASNASADYVLGQPDFTSASSNQGGSAGANTLATLGSATYAAGKIIVGDAMNARILIYSLDAAQTWQNKKSKSFYGGIKGKLSKTKISFSGRRTDLKKGRIYAYENGTLKKSVKIKKNGKWKLSFKDKQRSVNRVFQFRYYDSAGQSANVSDAFNAYLSAGAVRNSRIKSPIGPNLPAEPTVKNPAGDSAEKTDNPYASKYYSW